jgi:S1-C subfamily serine protease
MEFLKKVLKWSCIAFAVLLLGGIGGLIMDRRVVPSLVSKYPSLSRVPVFRDVVKNTTVIERTQQLVVREDDSVEGIVSQPATAVVNIIATAKTPGKVGMEPAQSQAGVLLTNDGMIVTYGDGIAMDKENRSYTALLFDGSSHPATLLGEDTLTDLLYFKINAGNLPAISLANSDDALPGKKLVAIGNSFEEYQNRFSIGVLSYRNKVFNLSGKTVASSEKWEGVFEMDTANGEKYSGGPAVNFRGEMVGLFGSLMIDNQSQVFLIPANAVRASFERARAGNFARPTLGVYYLTLTKASALSHGMSARDRGALIYSPSGKTGLAVLSGSPADKAGLRSGDIIIAVNGGEVNLDRPLSVAIGQHAKGETVTLLLIRDGKEITIPVTLE